MCATSTTLCDNVNDNVRKCQRQWANMSTTMCDNVKENVRQSERQLRRPCVGTPTILQLSAKLSSRWRRQTKEAAPCICDHGFYASTAYTRRVNIYGLHWESKHLRPTPGE
ncbi:hypothetical protein LSAT2_018845 [Lamellibrachia satsuma]|nr:hypothetical protein LSAT2_018845 [Lamellibrachia satsuma]